MSLKWTGSHNESGILRKSEFKEKKEELFVFGYSCKLFREDDRALLIDQGKHLIPWMGDDTLKIDRYDARGALHDLASLEAPPGGFDWRMELTRGEQDVEALCDEERYRALHTNEDEEEMYKEEELKRLHAAGYGQVGFNYDAPAEPEPTAEPVEVDEPFLPTPSFKALLPPDVELPETEKQNAIIEKTAKFIANQGAQMEILIKAKQGDNPQFMFLNKDSNLHPYYTALIALVKAGKWPEKKPETIEVEDKLPEIDDYLHPSLASTIIESAPSIPSIHYKPSADCDYTMLISKMRGEATLDEAYTPELAPGEVAPPGTEPLPPRGNAEISRAPVMYNRSDSAEEQMQTQSQQYAAYYHQYMAQNAAIQASQAQKPEKVDPPKPAPLKSTGLSLMKNYNTDSDSDVSDCDDNSSTDSKDKSNTITPPEDIQVVIQKMAAYVARNGTEFADIVRAKRDPRFAFLEPEHVYHAYYSKLLHGGRGDANKSAAPVSFSIKKLKEPDPILPKPALPYESSSDEESESKNSDKQSDKVDDKESPRTPSAYPTIPPVVLYKMEGTLDNNLASVTETIKLVSQPVPKPNESKPLPIVSKPAQIISKPVSYLSNKISEEKSLQREEKTISIQQESIVKLEVKKSPTPDKKVEKSREKDRNSPKKEKKKLSRKKDYHSKENRERRRSVDREKKREKETEKVKKEKRNRYSKEELESEIISLEDNSDDMIDLTGDQSDSKGEGDIEADRSKQQERRRRAAEFLKKVGVDPSAAALPTSSLASAMVDTLESIRKKKAEEEEKRRKREKRRHRHRHGHEGDAEKSHRKSKRRKHRSSDENDDADYDSSKKKKRKKEKKHSSKNKKKRRKENEAEVEEVDHPLPPDMDLTTTLKELRTSSPTKDLGLNVEEVQSVRQEMSSDEEVANKRKKKRKEDREYSEGEWSSDSDDSGSTLSKNGDY